MSKLLERIRKSIKKHNDSIYYGDMEDTAITVENYYFHNYITGNADIVETDTEDRGDDWTLWEITIYKMEVEGETAYFKVQKEVGRTKNHDDGGTVVEEVFPKKVTTIEYVSVKESVNKEKEQTDLVKAI